MKRFSWADHKGTCNKTQKGPSILKGIQDQSKSTCSVLTEVFAIKTITVLGRSMACIDHHFTREKPSLYFVIDIFTFIHSLVHTYLFKNT